jgi:hypothetical protein
MTKSTRDVEWHESEEVFSFLRYTFDVQHAKSLLRKKPREISSMNLEGVLKLVGEPPTGDSKLIHFGVIGIDWNVALSDKVDLTIPVLLVPFQDSYLPIDGWHRIAKAKVQKIEALPCVALTKAEAKKIKL